MVNKNKLQAGQTLHPPQTLAGAESFAFRSPLPLDECARQLMAQNNGSLLGRFIGMQRTRANLINAGMNDQHFAITNTGNKKMRDWVVGSVRDMDGEATWVEGQIGISTFDFQMMCLVVVVMGFFMLTMPFPAGMIVVMAIIQVLAFAYSIHATKVRMRRHVREVFGVYGTGPLPMEFLVKGLHDGR